MKSFLAILIVLGLSVPVWAEETVTKLDANSVRITISNVSDKEGVKTTISQEKTFTLDELTSAKSASESALKSWEDAKKKADENIAIQTEQVALWDRLIAESTKQGIVSAAKVEKMEAAPMADGENTVEELK